MSDHSPIGASGAHRWMKCPGSVRLSKEADTPETSVYAAQGTAAHWVLEECFPNKAEPGDYVGEEAPNGVILKEEDIEAVETAIKFLNTELEDGEYTVLSEVGFDLSDLFPDLWGTADVVLVSEDLTKLKVFDYKHGAGHKVEVKENKQLLYYGLGAVAKIAELHERNYFDLMDWGGVFEEVTIGIIQPRCFHPDGPLRKWKVPAERLNLFAVELNIAARATTKPDAPLVPGDHCTWCAGIALCGAFRKKVMVTAQQDFDVIDELRPPEPNKLSIDQLEQVLRFDDAISDWLKQCRAYAFNLLEKGGVVKGHKLVRKRSNRKWKNEDEAKEKLGFMLNENDLYDPGKFKSPAKIEKILKKDKDLISDLVFKPDAGLTLASEDDKREAVVIAIADSFDVIEQKGK